MTRTGRLSHINPFLANNQQFVGLLAAIFLSAGLLGLAPTTALAGQATDAPQQTQLASAAEDGPTGEANEDQDHSSGSHHQAPDEFKASKFIMEHVLDAHSWHITDLPGGQPVSLALPWIVYHEGHGLKVFTLHAHSHAELEAALHNKGLALNENERLVAHHGSGLVLDFSITKTVFQMFLIAALTLLVFLAVAKRYKTHPNEPPKGIQNLFEPVILFVRDDIAYPQLGERYTRYFPFLLTAFFFIWFSNLAGLTPFNINITGNISVTAGLTLFTFLIVQFSGTKDYWQHIFWFPGVPLPMKLIMLPVELIGVFSKPFALMVRLFANISAGHFMVVSLVMIIFIIQRSVGSVGAGIGAAVFSVAFTTFIMIIELLVAAIQAYVFTILSAVFIGQALESHDEHEEHPAEGQLAQA
jgi:F-type H+-transporting ATPase subunit a